MKGLTMTWKWISCGVALWASLATVQGATVVSSSTSGKMVIDTRAHEAVMTFGRYWPPQNVRYSGAAWDTRFASETAEVTADGVTLVTSSGEGQVTWRPERVGLHTLHHTAHGGTLTRTYYAEGPTVRIVCTQTGTAGSMLCRIDCDMPGATIYYTTDGTEPTTASRVYTGPFQATLPKVKRLLAVAVVDGYPMSQTAYPIISVIEDVSVVSIATSGKLVVDTRAGKGSIETDHAEDITYSNLWSGDANATATVAVNGEVVKTATNEGVYRWLPPSKGGNYVLTHKTTKNGTQVGATLRATFVVPSHEIEIDDGTGGSGGKNSRFSSSGVYDGKGHGISVKVTSVANPTIRYALAKNGPYVESLLLTNACDATAVWYTVAAAGYNTYTNWATVTITPRPVTLTSGTKTDFVYDGAVHTFPHIIISGQGFVAGEGVTTSNWATVTAVAEGEVENTFDYAAQEGTDLANYAVTVVTGKIAVVAAPIPVGPSGAIAAVGYTNVYDGAAHGVAVSVNGLLTTPTVQYRASVADDWGDTSPTFHDVCDTQVWYRVTAPNYAPVVGAVGVRITPRPVTLTSKSLAKPYDGTPLTLTAEDITVDGIVAGESLVYSDFASRTEAGQTSATFSFAAGANTNLSNYEITSVYGTLTVTRSATEITVTAKSGSWVYDGQSHTLHEYDATNLDTLQPGDELAVTFDVASVVTTPLDGTAGDGRVANRITAVRVMRGDLDVSANYTLAFHPGTLAVTKRPVTLTSKSGAKVYDGTPLTVHEVTIGGGGFVGDDGATYTFTGSQTTKGTSKNTFAYVLKDGTNAAFYDITKVEGDLVVTAADISAGDNSDWQIVLGPSLAYTGLEQIQTLSSVTYKGLPLDCSITGNAQTDAGSYAMTLAGQGNFAGTHDVAWTIAPKSLSLTAGSGSRVYDGTPLMVGTVTAIGFVSGEGAEYECAGSQTNVGSSQNNVAAINWNANTKGSNYAVTKLPGTLAVTPRPVTLTSKSGTKVYDGTPLTAHEVTVGGDGFADGEGATYAFTGSQTAVGESENAFTYTLNANTAAGNYEITTANGTLTVTKASIGGEDGGESGAGDVPAGGLSKFDAAFVYDGEGHTIDTNALRAAFGAALVGAGETKVFYGVAAAGAAATGQETGGNSASGADAATGQEQVADLGVAATGAEKVADWREAAPVYTNAGEYVIWYKVTNPNYENFVHAAKVTITKRPVTLTSGTKLDFVYDGQPHGFPVLGKSENGFVSGEDVTTSNWATVTMVAEGEVANTFDYAPLDGTDLANYAVTVVTGKIAVIKATVGPGGGEEPGADDVPAGGVSKFDATFVYDGEGHTINTNALQAAFGAALVGESAVEYALDDGNAESGGRGAPALPWGTAPVYTNAGAYAIWYKVTNPNYEDFVHAAKLTITKRPVTVRSRNLTKPYDGTPLRLTADDIDVALTDGGQGLPALPEGEAFAYGDFAELTAAGETAATFTVSSGAGMQLTNYDLTIEFGTLTVTRATYPGQEPGGAGIAWSVASEAATWMYDGKPHGVALTGVPAGVTARLAGNEATDAGDYVATVTFDYDAANYEPPVAPAPLAWSITRRPLTLMAASKEKPYDGFPLAVRPGDITASGSGYADGECFDYFGFASITDVGETAATFSYRDSATAKVANYDVTVVGGQTLKVTVGGDQVSVTADSATWAYDGAEHRAATWRVENGDRLLAGHELRVAIDPASVIRTPADGPDGDGVVSNRFASVRIVEAATDTDRTRNYNLVLKEGVLKMTNACIRAAQVAGAGDVEKTYDGMATQVVVSAALLQPARVRYWADGAVATGATLPEEGVWSEEPPRFAHATNAVVWFTVTADYYNAYTGRVAVAIRPRPITLTTPTKTKTYDGAPLTFGADEVSVGGDGFAPGESFTFSDFAAITDAGRVPARCAYTAATSAALPAGRGDGAAATGTRLADYAVTEDWGTLTVRASADEITVTADSATWTYDGTAHRLPSYSAENADKLQPGDELAVDFAPESVVLTPEDGPDGDGVVSNVIASVRVLRHGTADVTRNYSLAWHPGVLRVTKARVTFDGEGSVDPSAFSTAATYDGTGHTAAVVPPALLTAPVTVRYGTAADDVASDAAPAFTNAGVHTVFYAIDARYYETYFGSATVTIAPRPVTLVSGGAEKVYDGTPLRCDAVRVKDGSPGFVAGEGFAATCSGALTDVGAMENLFDYALTGGALAGNYAVAKEYGWLRVTPATLDPGAVFGGGETDADGNPLCARVYNGAPQPFALAPAFGEPYRLSYALVPGDESAYSETAPTRTHVAEGDLTVYFKFLSPNYAPYYGKGTLRIVPKALTEAMVVADEDAAWFFDGTEKRPAVTVVDGDPNIATADDYTLAYSGRTGAGLFPVTVTGRNNYPGTVTKEFAILKRPVAPPVIPSRAYSGRLQKPTLTADARWTVVANPGGTDAGLYTNVVLRLANTADYKWKGLGEDEADWTGVFEIRKGANGWSTYPGIRSWTNGVEAASEPTGRARFGTLSVAYRRRGASVATETAVRPSAPGLYTARFWVEETKNYAGVGLAVPYEVDFEIFRGPDDPPTGSATTTTPVPVPYAWLDAYVDRFGGGDYEAAAHTTGANGVTLWASYVAGLDPTDAASRFTAKIAVGADGAPRVTWSPDLREAEPPRAYTVYGKPALGAAAWTPVTDANRGAMRFFKVEVEIR